MKKILIPLILINILFCSCNRKLSITSSPPSINETQIDEVKKPDEIINTNDSVTGLEFAGNTANAIVFYFEHNNYLSYKIFHRHVEPLFPNNANIDHSCEEPFWFDCSETEFKINLEHPIKVYQKTIDKDPGPVVANHLVEYNIEKLKQEIQVKIDRLPTMMAIIDSDNHEVKYADSTIHLLQYKKPGQELTLVDILVTAENYEEETELDHQELELKSSLGPEVSVVFKLPKNYSGQNFRIDFEPLTNLYPNLKIINKAHPFLKI